jgi:hypothetical protein
MPGWYVDSTGRRLAASEWFPSARATYQPRDKRAAFSGVYRVDNSTPPAGRTMQAQAAPGDWPPAQAMAQGTQIQTPAAMTGPLQFEGFWLHGNSQIAQPGGQLLVLTAWRVTRSADAPLSIMAHLLDAQGRQVSGADGLGVPMELWQTGDMIVQAHWLDIPKNAAQGTYWIQTGVYRLDNMERYGILQGGQAVGDRLLLAPVEVKP